MAGSEVSTIILNIQKLEDTCLSAFAARCTTHSMHNSYNANTQAITDPRSHRPGWGGPHACKQPGARPATHKTARKPRIARMRRRSLRKRARLKASDGMSRVAIFRRRSKRGCRPRASRHRNDPAAVIRADHRPPQRLTQKRSAVTPEQFPRIAECCTAISSAWLYQAAGRQEGDRCCAPPTERAYAC